MDWLSKIAVAIYFTWLAIVSGICFLAVIGYIVIAIDELKKRRGSKR